MDFDTFLMDFYRKIIPKNQSNMDHFRSIKAYFFNSGPSNFRLFKIGPKPSRKYPQTVPKSPPNRPKSVSNFSIFSLFLVRKFRIFFDGFLMDFWWIFYSGEARGLVFWAMDPVWSPPQAPGGAIPTGPRSIGYENPIKNRVLASSCWKPYEK